MVWGNTDTIPLPHSFMRWTSECSSIVSGRRLAPPCFPQPDEVRKPGDRQNSCNQGAGGGLSGEMSMALSLGLLHCLPIVTSQHWGLVLSTENRRLARSDADLVEGNCWKCPPRNPGKEWFWTQAWLPSKLILGTAHKTQIFILLSCWFPVTPNPFTHPSLPLPMQPVCRR